MLTSLGFFGSVMLHVGACHLAWTKRIKILIENYLFLNVLINILKTKKNYIIKIVNINILTLYQSTWRAARKSGLTAI